MTATTTTSPLPSPAHAAGVAPGLRLVGVSKSFGHQTVLTGLDLSAYPGRVYGLLGLNGAGKSTAFNISLGLLKPDAGRVEIQGDPFCRRSLGRVGASINGPALFPQLSARRNLLVHCRLTGTSPETIAPLLERVGLAGVGSKRAGSFSTGMKVRLSLAMALLNDPEVLILDEPQNGLDPQGIIELRDLVRDLAAQGTAVLLTSHSMPEIEELADVISVIGAGRIVTRGSVGDIAAYAGITTTTTLTLPARHSEVTGLLQRRLAGEAVVGQRPSSGRWAVTVYWMADASPDAGLATLHEILSDRGAAAPADMVTRPASLEEAYLALADRIAR